MKKYSGGSVIKKTLLFLFICSFLFFTGAMCDFGSDSSGDRPGVTELEGTWVSNCWDDDGDGEYDKNIDTFTGNNFYVQYREYTDENCTIEIPGSIIEFGGTFFIGNEFTARGGERVKELDVFLDTGETGYELFYLQGNIFYVGDDYAEEYYDGSSPERRTRTVNYEEYFMKQ